MSNVEVVLSYRYTDDRHQYLVKCKEGDQREKWLDVQHLMLQSDLIREYHERRGEPIPEIPLLFNDEASTFADIEVDVVSTSYFFGNRNGSAEFPGQPKFISLHGNRPVVEAKVETRYDANVYAEEGDPLLELIHTTGGTRPIVDKYACRHMDEEHPRRNRKMFLMARLVSLRDIPRLTASCSSHTGWKKIANRLQIKAPCTQPVNLPRNCWTCAAPLVMQCTSCGAVSSEGPVEERQSKRKRLNPPHLDPGQGPKPEDSPYCPFPSETVQIASTHATPPAKRQVVERYMSLFKTTPEAPPDPSFACYASVLRSADDYEPRRLRRAVSELRVDAAEGDFASSDYCTVCHTCSDVRARNGVHMALRSVSAPAEGNGIANGASDPIPQPRPKPEELDQGKIRDPPEVSAKPEQLGPAERPPQSHPEKVLPDPNGQAAPSALAPAQPSGEAEPVQEDSTAAPSSGEPLEADRTEPLRDGDHLDGANDSKGNDPVETEKQPEEKEDARVAGEARAPQREMAASDGPDGGECSGVSDTAQA